MEKQTQRIGIMGGTFDPIHYGHLVTAEEARTRFGLEKVIFVPSGNPPHKKGYPLTPAEHRYVMTLMAVVSNSFFEVSQLEIERPGYSYTVDTIAAFRKIYGEEKELFFITGADAILEILTWRKAARLVSICSFIAATRPGFNLKQLDQVLLCLPPSVNAQIYLLEVPLLAISSTDIRQRVYEGRSIRYLTPEPVIQYIYKNRLYQGNAAGP